MKKLLFALIALALLLAACGGSTSTTAATTSGAAKTVEDYLAALVGQDADRISTLSCAGWEETALLELDSFQGVTARLDAPACAETGSEGDATFVKCGGKIIATYNNEDQELGLDARVYKVVQQGGDWRVCGYQD